MADTDRDEIPASSHPASTQTTSTRKKDCGGCAGTRDVRNPPTPLEKADVAETLTAKNTAAARTVAARPPAAEWPDSLEELPHGTPLLIGGRLQARYRDASWYERPNVHGIKAMHIVVVSHRLPIGNAGLSVGEAAACAPTRIILSGLGGDATGFRPHTRCLHPACAALFAAADRAAGSHRRRAGSGC